MKKKQIQRYKLKDGITKDDLIKCGFRPGGSFISKDAVCMTCRWLTDSIELNIGMPEDLSKWNDFDYVLVLDDDSGQPYTPFYDFMNGRIKEDNCFRFLKKVIDKYNKVMGSCPVLEETHEKVIQTCDRSFDSGRGIWLGSSEI